MDPLARSAEVAAGAFGVEESVIDGAKPLSDPIDQNLGERLDQRLVSREDRYLGRWLPPEEIEASKVPIPNKGREVRKWPPGAAPASSPSKQKPRIHGAFVL